MLISNKVGLMEPQESFITFLVVQRMLILRAGIWWGDKLKEKVWNICLEAHIS